VTSFHGLRVEATRSDPALRAARMKIIVFI
jgi:hypothetical protein